MTNGSPQQSSLSSRETRLSRRASSLKIARPNFSSSDGGLSEGEPSPKATPERHIDNESPGTSNLTRQVSHDGLASLAEKENDKKLPASDSTGRASPIRCVSEFDKASLLPLDSDGCNASSTLNRPAAKDAPCTQGAAHRKLSLLAQHQEALRVEADLHPMRRILFRLMTHIHFNRKGIFNAPVDPVALGLVDYFDVVKHPMDLGMVKKRLHSVVYRSRRDVADDIRLCFCNAMLYSPPHNLVHISAKELLAFFEDQVSCLCPDLVVESCVSREKSAAQGSPQAAEHSDPNVCVVAANVDSAVSNSNFAGTEGVSFSDRLEAVATSAAPAAFLDLQFPATLPAQKRKKRGPKSRAGHNCQWCTGNVCSVCEQGCLPLEPTLLICNGPHCVGIKVRKGATYFVAPDGSFQYCQRCYAGLAAVLPQSGKHDAAKGFRYKRDLLKRKNDEETAEQWITCSKCELAVHRMCVMFNPYIHDEATFCCPSCDVEAESMASLPSPVPTSSSYTFVAGSHLPVPMSDFASATFRIREGVFTAEALSETAVSAFIQAKVRDCMVSTDCPHADKTVVVRVISECERYFKVPEVIRKHFNMRVAAETETDGRVVPPSNVMYRSKAIALFQKHDGLDVCIFCMYVQEYNADDDVFERPEDKAKALQQKRVYVAYLDSVDHFRPRECRTQVYQEILTAYLASARMRGYEAAHIWACPPSRGNSFVFNNHPSAQRTPNIERLTAWYHAALGRAMDRGVVTDVVSLYESDFSDSMKRIKCPGSPDLEASSRRMTCPPLLEGDFWIEEALRVHSLTLSKCTKNKAAIPADEATVAACVVGDATPCPAFQVAALLRDKIISHPSSVAFRRPVNAAALNLKNYHNIISKPMDLATVYSRCVLGEYQALKDFVADVDLVFSNAMKFNPPDHVVHSAAALIGDLFLAELNEMTKSWSDAEETTLEHTWKRFADVSLSLDASVRPLNGVVPMEGTSAVQRDTIDVALPSAAVESSSIAVSAAVQTSLTDTIRLHAKAERTAASCASTEQPSVATCHSFRSDHDLPVSDGRSVDAEDILRRMVGSDVWLLDKKNPVPPKELGLTKTWKRGRKSAADPSEEPASKRRRQTWLGEEVGRAVRKMRTNFFKCILVPDAADVSYHAAQRRQDFERYTQGFKDDGDSTLRSSRVADARHALLEFSQFRSLEFDTLRRAKYSSAVLLYYLHNEGAPGVIPECTSCRRPIQGVCWHRLHRVIERRPPPLAAAAAAATVATATAQASHAGRKRKSGSSAAADDCFEPQELCATCYALRADQDVFIPLQVSI